MCSFLLVAANVQGQEEEQRPETVEKVDQKAGVETSAIMEEDLTGFWEFFKRRILNNFKSGVTIEERFDDNVYDTWGDVKNKADFITKIEPYISYKYSPEFFGGKSKINPQLEVELRGDVEYYVFSPKLNEQDGADFNELFYPKFSVSIEEPTRGLTLYFEAERNRENSSEIDALIGAIDKTKVDTNKTTYGVTYEFGPKQIKWLVGYEHTHDGYGGKYRPFDKGTDKIEVTTINEVGEGVLPSIIVGYDMENTEYLQEDTDNTSGTTYNMWAGLKGKFSPKIEGSAKVGYGILSTDDRRKDPFAAIVWVVDMTYKITDRFSCDFIVSRHVGNVFDEGETSVNSSGGDSTSFNIAGDLKGSNEYSVGCTYTPPFLSDNLVVGADFSQYDLVYLSGGTKKVREAGLSYRYIWNDRSKGWWKHKWTLTGEYKFRRVSPSESWDRFLDNEISLLITMEF